jgi:tripartite-type tricarboxylate transporter receptor subunit TctC
MKLIFAAALSLSCFAAHAWPTKPVRIVVAYPPGGGIDVMARQLAEKLTPAWGQSVVVENKPGANTIVATDAVAKSDNHTILMTTDATFSINPHLYAKLPYDVQRDFIPVTMLVLLHQLLVAHPSLPANTIAELIALAKAKPGAINYASYGSGSQPHLAGEMLKNKAGIDLVHVPYKGISHRSNPDASRRSPSAATIARHSSRRCRLSASSATRKSRRTPGSGCSSRPIRPARR